MSSDASILDSRALAALVCKDGLSLGNLSALQRLHALALAAAALPAPGTARSEAEINAALQSWLEGPGAFVDVDHVELRRWLCDTALVRRDGFGRAYERAAAGELPAPLRAVVDAVAAIVSRAPAAFAVTDDANAWILDQRQRRADERAERARAWTARRSDADGTR